MLALLLLATVYVGTIGDRLEYGTPSASDVIAARKGYVVGFNDKTHCPDWTVHRLRAEQLNGAKVKRSDDFRHDAQIPRSAELIRDHIEAAEEGWPDADSKYDHLESQIRDTIITAEALRQRFKRPLADS